MNHHQDNLKLAPLFYTRELLGVWSRQHPDQAELCQQAADLLTQEPERAKRIISLIYSETPNQLVEDFLAVVKFIIVRETRE
jgi:hypothetical protein